MNLRIIAAQLNLTVGDTQGNLNLITQAIERARNELKADIIVFPELTISGYPPEDLLYRPAYLDEVDAAMDSLVAQADGITLIVGHPQQTPLGLCNAVTVLQDKKWVITYQKRCLPNTQVFDEKRYFEPGRDSATFYYQGATIGLAICEDIWHPEPLEALKNENTDLVIVCNASPFSADKMNTRLSILKAQARSIKAPIVYVNLVGGQDELIFDGGSLAMNAQGEIVSQAPVFEECLWPIDCVIEGGAVTIASQTITPLPEPAASMYQAVVMGVRDYFTKNKFPGILVGLSGGIDSALTLAIAVDAIGADRVEAVLMPSRYTSELSNELALAQAKKMGVRYKTVPIEPAHQAFLSMVPEATGIAEQNIQARSRGIVLMTLSNQTGYLVLTTGNKSEYATGYATLYGDMCGGYAPLKDVSKTWVYAMAEYRNGIELVIPQAVIERPPTAELAPNQRDSDSLPDYPVLDKILALYVEQGQSVDQIVHAGFDRNDVERFTTLLYRNEYKRRQSPPGPKVTNKAFGRDRRYPITSGYQGKS